MRRFAFVAPIIVIMAPVTASAAFQQQSAPVAQQPGVPPTTEVVACAPAKPGDGAVNGDTTSAATNAPGSPIGGIVVGDCKPSHLIKKPAHLVVPPTGGGKSISEKGVPATKSR